MKTLVLTLLLACPPPAAGVCSAQYFACSSIEDCLQTRVAAYNKYRALGRFTRIEIAWHDDWPSNRAAWGMVTPQHVTRVNFRNVGVVLPPGKL